MSLKALTVAVAIFLMLPGGSASAEVRSGSVSDPADAPQHQNVDGTSNPEQDIQAVTASYDTAGAITMTFYFFNPVPASTPETLKAYIAPFCNSSTGVSVLTLYPSSSKTDLAFVTVAGLEGSVAVTKTLSADRRAITLQASSWALANRDFTCVWSIALSHQIERFNCSSSPPYTCSNYWTVITDETAAFNIDAATPATPAPPPEATVTPEPEPEPTETATDDRCADARSALRKNQKQVKKLTAQRRNAHKAARKASLAKQIKTAKRGVTKSKAVIAQHC